MKIIRLHFQTTEGFHTTVNFLKQAGLLHTSSSGVSSKNSPFPRERTQSAVAISNPTGLRCQPVMGPPTRALSRSGNQPVPSLRRVTAKGYEINQPWGSQSHGYGTSTNDWIRDLSGSQDRIAYTDSAHNAHVYTQQPYARPATSQQYRDNYVPPTSFDPEQRFDEDFANSSAPRPAPSSPRLSASQIQQNPFDQDASQNGLNIVAPAYRVAPRSASVAQNANMRWPGSQLLSLETTSRQSSLTMQDSSLNSLHLEWPPIAGPKFAERNQRMPSPGNDIMPPTRNIFTGPKPPHDIFQAADAIFRNECSAQTSFGSLTNDVPVLRHLSVSRPHSESRPSSASHSPSIILPASTSRPPSRLTSGLQIRETRQRTPLVEVTQPGNYMSPMPRNDRSSALGTTKATDLPTRRNIAVSRSNARAGVKKPQVTSRNYPVSKVRKAKTIVESEDQAQLLLGQAASNAGSRLSAVLQSSQKEGNGVLEIAAASCTRCRRKHIGCDRLAPTCGSCAKTRSACVYFSKRGQPEPADSGKEVARNTGHPMVSHVQLPAVALGNETQRHLGKKPVMKPTAGRDTAASEVEEQVRRQNVKMVDSGTCTGIDYTTAFTQTDMLDGLRMTFRQWADLMAAGTELRKRKVEEAIRDTGSFGDQGPRVVRHFLELKEELRTLYKNATENNSSHEAGV